MTAMNDDVFALHRRLLFTVAYEMLGSASDADDVVQETWLRWDGVDQNEVRDSRAYLVRIVTRQALNRLRTLSRRREDYIGEWLPEPVATAPDLAIDVELVDSVSIAMLTMLETLGATERAVFVLHEVFDTPYNEIAEAVDKSTDAVRQIAHRARQHVAARRPRIEVTRSEFQAVVDRFLAAVRNGDVRDLLAVLAPEVVLLTDGGGLVAAARHPIKGADRVAVLIGRASRLEGLVVHDVWLNGSPAACIDLEGRIDTALSVTVEAPVRQQLFRIDLHGPNVCSGIEERTS